jgi:hypothetical protein
MAAGNRTNHPDTHSWGRSRAVDAERRRRMSSGAREHHEWRRIALITLYLDELRNRAPRPVMGTMYDVFRERGLI